MNVEQENEKMAESDGFEVIYRPEDEIDMAKEIVEFEREKRGNPEYEIPTDPAKDNIPPRTEEDEWHFAWIGKDELHIMKTSQRSREHTMSNDKIIRRMENGQFEWSKFEPLVAVLYIDKDGKEKFIITEGQGRYIFALRHPSITELPVVYRKSRSYSKVAETYMYLHDTTRQTKIENVSDFMTYYNQGRPEAIEFVNGIKRHGFQFTDRKMKWDREDCSMIFDGNDLMYALNSISFQKTGRRISDYQMQRIDKIISKYAIIRSELNNGNPYKQWAKLMDNLWTAVENTRRKFGNTQFVTFENLIQRPWKPLGGDRRTLEAIRKLFTFDGRITFDSIRKYNIGLLKFLKSHDMIGAAWQSKPSGNYTDTYYDALVDQIKMS